MSNKLLVLEVDSPEALEKALNNLSDEDKAKVTLAKLNIYGRNILIRQFELPFIKRRELESTLKLEAVELLSLRAEEIVFDYQAFYYKDKIKGVFVVMPKKILDAYMAFFRGRFVIPVILTAKILGTINLFLDTHKGRPDNFCFLDFSSPNTVNISVFSNSECELLREIQYNDPERAGLEIKESLKYFFGRSSSKHLDKIYFSGMSLGVEALIEKLKIELNIEAELVQLQNDGSVISQTELFKINLIRNQAVSIVQRNTILKAANFIVALGIVILVISIARLIKTNLDIGEIKQSYVQSDYQHALDLESKIKLLKNAK